MAGHAGAVEQAAVALGVAFWMPVFITLMSVVQAISPSVAQHFGAETMRRWCRTRTRASGLLR